MAGMRQRRVEADPATLLRPRRGGAGEHGCTPHSTCPQVGSHAGAMTTERELDQAFVRWLERRVADSVQGGSDDVINYLIGVALTKP
jgi:hypothetical protein